MLLPLVRGFADFFANHVKTISDAVVLVTSRMTNVEQIVNTLSAKMFSFAEVEQNVSSLTTRMCNSKTNIASASSVPGSARSWPSPGQVDGSAVTGSHRPGSFDDNRNTRRKLDTFQTWTMKMLDVPSCCSSRVNNSMLACLLGSISSLQQLTFSTANMHIRLHARQVPNLPGLSLRQELYVKTL